MLLLAAACGDDTRTAQQAISEVSGIEIPGNAKVLHFADGFVADGRWHVEGTLQVDVSLDSGSAARWEAQLASHGSFHNVHRTADAPEVVRLQVPKFSTGYVRVEYGVNDPNSRAVSFDVTNRS